MYFGVTSGREAAEGKRKPGIRLVGLGKLFNL